MFDWSLTVFVLPNQGMLNNTIVLQLLEDGAPEDKEEYRVTLSNIHTQGNGTVSDSQSV